MRIFTSALALLAALGLGTLAPAALGAGDNPTNSATPADTLLDVHSKDMKGATFTVPATGLYDFTIISGAFCYLPLKPGETSPFGGWLTQIEIHTKAVEWGTPDQWGKHPLHAKAVLGDKKHQATSAAAETAGKGATVTLNLQQGTVVTLLVSDGTDYYGDNQGTIKVRITPENGTPAPAAPAPATPPASSSTPAAPAAPPTPAGSILTPSDPGTTPAPKTP